MFQVIITKAMLPAVFSRSVRQKLNYKQIKNKIMDFETLGDWCKWLEKKLLK